MFKPQIPLSKSLALALISGLVVACGGGGKELTKEAPPTAEAARAFVAGFEGEARPLITGFELAAWNRATNITDETQAAEAKGLADLMAFYARTTKRAAAFDGVEVDAETRRQLELIKRGLPLSAPSDPEKGAELAKIASELGSIYGKGKYCTGGSCRDLQQLSEVLAESGDWDALIDVWRGWREVSVPMRPLYQRFVELANEGAREIGYADLGAQWLSGYDMSPDRMRAEVDRLWKQVRPFYEQLHCYARAKLVERWGAERVPPEGRIPAQLLGNMWSQTWENIFPLLAPYPDEPPIDIGPALVAKEVTSVRMVKMGEAFFTSLGLDPLPETFWERSMFVKPDDREVECHASAWDVAYRDDLRIKMCIRPTMEDFVTIHHELGHDYYYHYYHQLPIIYQQGANDGFHEGIGDTLALSVTPSYLANLGLLDAVGSGEEALLNRQMLDALSKVAFLPFALVVDGWRWGVFAGRITPDRYNAAWWDLRRELQGIEPPVERTEADFDPGAKYHIPGNTPYLRYFLATFLQYQFHRALCRAAGHEGPLYECSIYGSQAAGDRLRAMLAMGATRPWQDALEAMTGERQIDAGALLEYLAPVHAWLDKQNEGRHCGW